MWPLELGNPGGAVTAADLLSAIAGPDWGLGHGVEASAQPAERGQRQHRSYRREPEAEHAKRDRHEQRATEGRSSEDEPRGHRGIHAAGAAGRQRQAQRDVARRVAEQQGATATVTPNARSAAHGDSSSPAQNSAAPPTARSASRGRAGTGHGRVRARAPPPPARRARDRP